MLKDKKKNKNWKANEESELKCIKKNTLSNHVKSILFVVSICDDAHNYNYTLLMNKVNCSIINIFLLGLLIFIFIFYVTSFSYCKMKTIFIN